MLIAGYGVGKTFVAIDWMMHIATGREWQGHKVEQGRTLYILGEGAAGMSVRVPGWRQEHDVALEDFHGVVKFCKRTVNLTVSDQVKELAEIVRDFNPSLIVFDTLARSTVGRDENGSMDMGIAIDMADQLRRISGACILLIHHTGHQNQDRGRGSSALGGAVDTEMVLTRNGDSLTLKVTKQKDDAQAEPICLGTKEIFVERKQKTTLVITNGGVLPAQEGPKVSDRVAMNVNALKAIMRPDGVPSGEWLAVSEWKDKTAKAGFYNMIKEAIQLNLVLKKGDRTKVRYFVTTTESTTPDIHINLNARDIR
jgi:hypothetical protein